eukprot:1175512-Prorocentrum_minimum.AAC.5
MPFQSIRDAKLSANRPFTARAVAEVRVLAELCLPLARVYDVVTARAVAEMRVLAELCLPLARVEGFLVAYKVGNLAPSQSCEHGANPEEEIEAADTAIKTMGGNLLKVVPVDSQAPGGSRTAVVIQKASPTPAKYPRRPGLPNKRPL